MASLRTTVDTTYHVPVSVAEGLIQKLSTDSENGETCTFPINKSQQHFCRNVCSRHILKTEKCQFWTLRRCI